MNSRDLRILQKIQKHTEASSMRVEATVFNLMQIGELAKASLSDEAKEQLPSIPWYQIYGLRNRIVHGYDGVHLQIVWDTVFADIPALHEQLTQAIGDGREQNDR